MPVPSPRNKILPVRGNITTLQANLASLLEGEICYALDEDQYYQVEGGALVSVGATKVQGALADSAVQPLDNISTLTNDAGYITLAEVPADAVSSVNTQTGAVVLGFADVGAASTAQGALADTATQPNDNVSTLTNDAGYITATGTYWTEGTNQLYPADAGSNVLIGGALPSSPNITLAAAGAITTLADASINTLTVGLGGGSVSSNTAVGDGSLSNNTTGLRNTAVGQSALRANTEGTDNVAVGRGTLFANTTGTQNTSVGQNALNKNITGDLNTAVGQNAGLFIEGSNNTVLGAYVGTSADSTLSSTVIISAGTTERMRINSTGNLLFGGTLPSTPNIELNADGSAEFAGNVKVKGSRSIVLGTTQAVLGFDTTNHRWDVYSNDGGGFFGFYDRTRGLYTFAIDNTSGDVTIGGTSPSAPSITLNANGSAEFAGKLVSASTVIGDTGTTLATKDYVDSSAGGGAVDSVNSQTGVVVLDADDIDDTSTTNKFATAAQLADIGTAVQPGDLATVATSGAYNDLSGTPATAVPATGGTFTGEVTFSGDMYNNGIYTAVPREETGSLFDLNLSNYHYKNVVSAVTISFTGIPSNRVYSWTLELILGGSGSITWPSSVDWPGGTAPTIPTNKSSLFMFVTRDGGTNIYGSSLLEY